MQHEAHSKYQILSNTSFSKLPVLTEQKTTLRKCIFSHTFSQAEKQFLAGENNGKHFCHPRSDARVQFTTCSYSSLVCAHEQVENNADISAASPSLIAGMKVTDKVHLLFVWGNTETGKQSQYEGKGLTRLTNKTPFMHLWAAPLPRHHFLLTSVVFPHRKYSQQIKLSSHPSPPTQKPT